MGLDYRCTVVSMATYPSFLLGSSVLRRLKWQPLWHKWFSQQADLWTRVRPVYLLATHQPYSLIAFFLKYLKAVHWRKWFYQQRKQGVSKSTQENPSQLLSHCMAHSQKTQELGSCPGCYFPLASFSICSLMSDALSILYHFMRM